MTQTETTPSRHSPLSAAEERELVRRCQAGQTEAFERLVETHRDAVFGLAFRLTGHYDDANDVAQEVFVLAFRKIGQFQGASRLKTWLYRIAVNTTKNFWKRRERRGYSVTDSIDEPIQGEEGSRARDVPSTAPDPARHAAGKEAVEALQASMSKLNPEQREALTLRCVEGLSYDEIAEISQCNLGTVKSRINRARAELRVLMKDWL
jgi:RNA polymerase sigma-70 factor (ECF subfamily)